MVRTTYRKLRNCAAVLGMLSLLAPMTPLSAQEIGIMVQPVLLEVQPRPGESVTLPVSVRSTSATATQRVEAALWPLYQSPDGRFTVIEPGPDPIPPPPGQSCLPFASLDRTELNIAPGGVEILNVSLKVPANASGFYSGALIVQTVPEQRPGVIALRVRFLVPILVHVQGRAVTRKITVTGAEMQRIVASEKNPPGTLFSVGIQNTGETLAKVSGVLNVFVESGGRWRRVASLEVPERRLLPGTAAKVPIQSDLRLPAGKYRLVPEIVMDGARLSQAPSEVQYEGDPEVATVATAAEMSVMPSIIEVSCAPGATRTTSLTVRNDGSDPFVASATISIPSELQAVAIPTLKGEDLDGSKFVDLSVSQTQVAPGRETRMRLTVRLPAEGADRPAYYATVHVKASTASGQEIGEAPVLIIIRNQKAKGNWEIVPSGRVTLVKKEDGTYQAIGRFANIGTVDGEFRWAADLLEGGGPNVAMVLRRAQEGSQRLIPLQTAVCSVDLDLSRLTPGTYTLRFMGRAADGEPVYLTTGIRISTGPNGKEVEVLQPPDGSRSEPVASGSQGKGKGRR
ncbi:MAG: hypothetical protein KatS3mg015_2302 [Fimbriimonadales bacterium]|nr:MAG: hypothetical protein KatS3mg015_2302 [Fimbriimonadales bacterium]